MHYALETFPTERAQIKIILELKPINLSYLKCSLPWNSSILLLLKSHCLNSEDSLLPSEIPAFLFQHPCSHGNTPSL